ncbi:MAG: hypothetical protein A2149_03110 [Candidatus Schekmanbacteria bacterium RBG_16_38_11]|uniref:Glycosyl transferase family 1 n=1 Tax=Candidatus Schekmanbacteria bacterium RBG_16_38_11 TaxID=1817880 RepID=A0A1F7RVM3_9BACT|nr:MAG: hypothetical protein A2149_03110 [Candidatus Schekmanbacteria bacterium RBG_16_38_11]
MRKLNIIHVISSHHLTGAAAPALSLSLALKQLGHNVFFFCSPLKGNLASHARKLGVDVETSLFLQRGINLVKTLRDILRLSKEIDSRQIDILHCHLSNDQWIAKFSSSLSKGKPKIVRTVHNQKSMQKRRGYKILYEKICDAITTVSRFHKSMIIENFRINPDKVKVIPGSVDLRQFDPSLSSLKIRQEFSINQDFPVIGMVARFKPGRGHNLILEALPFIKTRYKDIKLVFAGKGETLPRIREMAKELGLIENVIFAGYRKDDLPCLYAAMDVSILLAEGNDGSCRAALEAMACGRPVVAFDFGAIREIITDGVNGLISANQNVEDLKNKLLILLGDKKLRENMGREARFAAEKYFDSESEARSYEKLYMGLLA